MLRIKGFVSVAGKPMRLQVQAVGPRVSHYFDRPWGEGEARLSRLVVIGEKAALRTLQLGRSLGDDREVLEGLGGGDAVVLDPSEQLVDGARVRLAREDSASESNNE